MKEKIINATKIIILGLIIGFGVNYIFANFTAPLHAPPTCLTGEPGCDAPINVSNTPQHKNGPLTIGGSTDPSASYKLDVPGLASFTGIATQAFTMTTGAGDGKVLTSDASGVASWGTPAAGGGGGGGVTSIVAGTGISVSSSTGDVTVSSTQNPVSCTWYASSGPVGTTTFNSNGGTGACKATIPMNFMTGQGSMSYGNMAPTGGGSYSCVVAVINNINTGALHFLFTPFSYLGCTGIQ